MLYELLCGDRPFTGDSAVEVGGKIALGEDPIFIRKKNSTISMELEDFVLLLMEPDKRYRLNARPVLNELNKIIKKDKLKYESVSKRTTSSKLYSLHAFSIPLFL